MGSGPAQSLPRWTGEPGGRGYASATFIVRLTQKPGAPWRGEVVYVQEGERRPVRDAAAAFDQVRAWLERKDRGDAAQGGLVG